MHMYHMYDKVTSSYAGMPCYDNNKRSGRNLKMASQLHCRMKWFHSRKRGSPKTSAKTPTMTTRKRPRMMVSQWNLGRMRLRTR